MGLCTSRAGKARLIIAAAAASVLGIVSNHASAATAFYWDMNGATAGAGGAAPAGTWNTTNTNWTTSSGGTVATVAWPNNTQTKARIAAGTDATGPYTITVSGSVNVVQIGLEAESTSNAVTFSGGTITFVQDTHPTSPEAANYPQVLGGFTGGPGNLVLASKISGSVGFRSGLVSIAGFVTTLSNSANDFTGGVTVGTNTTIANGASDVIPDSNTLSVLGTYNLAGFNETVATLSGSGGVTTNGGTLTINAPSGQTYSGAISQAGAVIKNGAGTQIFTGANTYTGGTTINNGTLQVGAGSTIGAISNTGGVVNNGTLAFNRSDNITYSGAVTGSGAVTQMGAGILTFSSASNAYNGVTNLNNGTLSMNGTSTLGAGAINFNGGNLRTSASRTPSTAFIPNALNITADGAIFTTATASTIELNLSGNTMTGSGGTLTFRNDSATANAVFQPRFSGSGFNFPRPIILTNGIIGAGTTTVLQSYNILGTTQTFSGVISGNGSFTRNASATTGANSGGETIFTAGNTYTGATNVNRGTLTLNRTGGDSLIFTSGINIDAFGTLKLAQSNQIADGIPMNMIGSTFDTGGFSDELSTLDLGIGGPSIIDLASGASILKFADSSAMGWDPLHELHIYNYSGIPYFGGGIDQLHFGTSPAGLLQSQLDLIKFYSDGGTTFLGYAQYADQSGGPTGEVVPTPEPASLGLLAMAAPALLRRRRRD
jgi:fibronectin-binding autotransporter adhesin